MDREYYEQLQALAIYLFGIFMGILVSICILVSFTAATPIQVNATDSLGNNYTFVFDLPNQTIIYNNSYNYLNVTNQTYIYNYTLNQSAFYNITNITCINCSYSYNITNITYVNQTNITQYFNGTNFNSADYYTQGEINSKIDPINTRFNDYLLKSDYKTPIVENWRNTDTIFIIWIGIITVVILFMGFIILRSGGAE